MQKEKEQEGGEEMTRNRNKTCGYDAGETEIRGRERVKVLFHFYGQFA